MGLPLLLRAILPVGLLGVMLSVYFSAILSTADSCLMAASGNLLTDIVERFRPSRAMKHTLRLSQLFTLGLGAIAIGHRGCHGERAVAHAALVRVHGLRPSGPLGRCAVSSVKRDARAALAAMVIGGGTTVALYRCSNVALPFGLDANIFGILGRDDGGSSSLHPARTQRAYHTTH